MVSKSFSAFKSNLRASQLISTSLTSVPEFFRFCSCYVPKSKLSRISRVLPSSRCLIFKVHPLDFLRLFAAFRPLGRPPFFCPLSRALDYHTTPQPFCQHLFYDFFEVFCISRFAARCCGHFSFRPQYTEAPFSRTQVFPGMGFFFFGKSTCILVLIPPYI